MRVVFRTRVQTGWWDVDDITTEIPGDTTGFTIVVHDPEERYFGADHAHLLHDLSREPKALFQNGCEPGTDLAFAQPVNHERKRHSQQRA